MVFTLADILCANQVGFCCGALQFFCRNSSVTIESTGALPPEELFTEAVKILEEKSVRVITVLA